ncbi:polysaccharide biosynthesis protein [Streptomyces sp. TRM66268-LWL]|uniref:Polysaccharide biosynthesis protein n=1 Tax=Streptomyces polyasparticus TaxID=2767826 RepID=A0ABR7SPK9_9ACTN|nr:Wzz/FepE/Etk N-terminal domain-containing protein [Streptomyces polyasparticus]MBC9717412.1 polysaccharide biosynthesis protein [Streptomyces polyasparticus]
MSDDTIRLATIGRMINRRWRLLTALALVGALVGLGISLVFPPRYTTSAFVLLSGQWEERELLTQVEIATSSVVVDRAARKLGDTGLKDRVSAKAAEGNIIEISGTDDTPEGAQRLADLLADEYVAFAARLAGDTTDSDPALRPDALKKLVVKTSRRITELAEAADPGQSVESVQGRTELEKLRTALQEAVEKLQEVDPALNRANMVVMGPAARPAGEAPPTRSQLVLGGALLFVVCAVIGHLAAARMSRRLRTEPEIAAALGSASLGSVDVPGGRAAPAPLDGGTRARIRRLLGVDTRWDTPTLQASGGEGSRRIRYGRVCARLQEQLPLTSGPLLVIALDDDGVGRVAAERLAAEAGGDPALEVVVVSGERPLVPDHTTESGALVVLGAGSRTAAELTAVADACTDAGHGLLGFVLAGTVVSRASGGPSEGRVPAMAGGDPRGGAA